MNKITEQLTSANPDIKVWTGAAATSLDDVYAQINELGALTGRVDNAEEVVASMKSRVDAAVPDDMPTVAVPVFYELDNTLYSVTSNTFVGALLKQFNMISIADGRSIRSWNDAPY